MSVRKKILMSAHWRVITSMIVTVSGQRHQLVVCKPIRKCLLPETLQFRNIIKKHSAQIWSSRSPRRKYTMNIVRVNNHVRRKWRGFHPAMIVAELDCSQSWKMSRIWRIYPCKKIGQLGVWEAKIIGKTSYFGKICAKKLRSMDKLP